MSARPVTGRRRRLAGIVLLVAASLAVLAFPFRQTWWGGWVLAIAEAGVVGGLADWFAVTALFRRPLGLPIPHTALIPANWELMAARVGSMVGGRVLTTEYVTREIARVDVAELLARGAELLTPGDLDAGVRAVARWAAGQLPTESAAELAHWIRQRLAREPIAPILADVLDVARRHEWDERFIEAAALALATSLERPGVREAVSDLVDGVVGRYRRSMGVYSNLLIGLANALGLIDRDRLAAALQRALTGVAENPDDPLRRRLSDLIAELPERLRSGDALAKRVETAKSELLQRPAVAQLVEDAARGLHRALAEDLARPDSEVVRWVGRRIEEARLALVSDGSLRRELDRWLKGQAVRLVEGYQDRVAVFIERGVHALGPAGAVRLIEEHAGDDLQFIRVNGTVVGGLAGGAIYAIHLLLRLV